MEYNEKFIDKNIAELCETYDKIHGENVNLARITPELIDGLKPVQRRALYIMYLKDGGKTFRKLATISGEVFGRVHPHSPVSIEDAIVAIEQGWKNAIPLVDGSGNFGTVSGDIAGASRYVKARLSEYARACFFDDWKYSVVDMDEAYDEETMEPRYLPAKYPNVMLNGCLGIGYGLGTNIPCFNFRELINATILLMMNPKAKLVLIPDSPTGCDIVESDFGQMCERGTGSYTMRCKYEIDAENNEIIISALPYQVSSKEISIRIAEIKERNGLPEILTMDDLSGDAIDLHLKIRDDVNPYKFMKKLIDQISGLERSYPVNITIVHEYQNFDWSIRRVLLEWIQWRREQKRLVVSHRHTSLLADQRTNDVKIFLMNERNLEDTIAIYRNNRNREAIEKALIAKYRDTEIRMDSIQARTLSNLRLVDLSIDAYEACLKRREEILKELQEVEEILNRPNGVDELIVAELRDGAKRFGVPRRSNVVPKKISVTSDIVGTCIVQLASDGTVLRKEASNVYEEPIPTDSNGFAVRVENDAAFILIDENGYHTFVRVRDIPTDSAVPVHRYAKRKIGNRIVAMLPSDIDSDICCTLISEQGVLKRIRVADMSPSKRPCIDLASDDRIVRGIQTKENTKKDLLVYTDDGMGQRLDPNSIRITSPSAKGRNGFKLKKGDHIVGCYAINPAENAHILYVTAKGKARLNLLEYLPARDSKHDAMLPLIPLNDRDRLVSVIGCNRLDKVQVFYDDGTDEIIEVEHIPESTMSAEPKKVTKKNAVSTRIVKVKLA